MPDPGTETGHVQSASLTNTLAQQILETTHANVSAQVQRLIVQRALLREALTRLRLGDDVRVVEAWLRVQFQAIDGAESPL